MIKKIEREVPLYESFGVFTEAPRRRKKRKPKIVSVNPRTRGHNYLNDIDGNEEEIDLSQIDPDEEDFSDYSDFSDQELSDIENELNAIGNEEEPVENPDDTEEPIEEPFDPDGEPNPEEPENPEEPMQDDIEEPVDPEQPQEDIPAEDNIEEPFDTENPQPEEPAEPEAPEDPLADTVVDPNEQPEGTDGQETPPADNANPGDGIEEPVNVDDNTGQEPPQDGGDGIEEPFDPDGGDEQNNPEGGENVTIDPNEQNGEDFTAEIDDPNADPNQAPQQDQQPPQDPNAGGQDPNKPVTKDDVKKYVLYKKFMELHENVDYYITKLEPIIVDNTKFAFAIKSVLNTFKSLKSLLKDYMILKYSSDSYLQNVFFYEKIKANINLNIELLQNNLKEENN